METQHAHMHAPPPSHLLLYRVGQGSRSPWLSCFFVQIDATGPRRETWTRWPGEKLARPRDGYECERAASPTL